MRYTIPQLEGLAQAIAEINKDLGKTDNDDDTLSGADAINALSARGFLK